MEQKFARLSNLYFVTAGAHLLDVVESVGTAVVCLLLVLLTGDSVVDEQRNTAWHATTTSTKPSIKK